jgi:DNA-binding response OmpR family regulator
MRMALADCLLAEGYRVLTADNGQDGLDKVIAEKPDLIILDIMLPRLNGFALCAELRRLRHLEPVLMLTAKGQIQDRVSGLDAGADDYLVKPFELEEFLARLRALTRRPALRTTPVLRHGGLEVDPRSRTARWKGADLDLTPKEYGLLELLLRRRGTTLSRTQIFEQLYDSQSDSSDKVVEVILSTLRTKLAEHELKDLIVTRRGFGYVIP